jgi:hypothetical protein
MSISKIQSNYPEFTAENIQAQNKQITLRSAPNQGEDPMSWSQLDNNFELLRYTINQVVDDLTLVRGEFTYDDEIEEVAARVLALEQVSSSLRLTDLETDVKALQDINAGTRLTALETVDADTRLNTLEEIDSELRLTNIENSISDIYTKSESDALAYTKVESDAKYALIGDIVDSYTKYESDEKYALASAITPHTNAYTKVESDARYALIGSTNDGDGGSNTIIGTWENVAVQVAQGELYETSDSIIEQIASANVIALREAITAALCDNSTAQTEPQTFTGCVRLPAGRIYLNERIVITMPATLGHNLPNSITIEGVGQGNTQLCWTNNASSFGILIEQGPYGATMSQRIVVRDLDFIMGYQGLNNGSGVGAPANQTEGLLYARGTALEVTGDRLDIGVSGATSTHAELTGYDKTPGHGLKPNTIVENCNFMGWHFSYAGWDKCIIYEDSQLSDIKGCCFTGAIIDTGDGKPWATSKSAIHITGDAKCTDYYLTENRFFGFEYGILCDGNIEGVTIQHSTWVNTHHGIWWAVEKIGGGQPAYDPDTNTFTSGSTDGTSISGVAQWPLLVVTDCHINALETCIHIHNGWQIMIKGCSFYGINIAQAYGTGHGFDAYHKSINIDNQSSNVMITANTFSDVSNTTSATDGGYGPSIDIDGHFNLVDGNTFTRDGNRDEPHVRLSGRASGNTVQNNTVITSLAQNWADGGVPVSVIPGNLLNLHIEDNNTGTYNGVAIHTNRKLNNS